MTIASSGPERPKTKTMLKLSCCGHLPVGQVTGEGHTSLLSTSRGNLLRPLALEWIGRKCHSAASQDAVVVKVQRRRNIFLIGDGQSYPREVCGVHDTGDRDRDLHVPTLSRWARRCGKPFLADLGLVAGQPPDAVPDAKRCAGAADTDHQYDERNGHGGGNAAPPSGRPTRGRRSLGGGLDDRLHAGRQAGRERRHQPSGEADGAAGYRDSRRNCQPHRRDHHGDEEDPSHPHVSHVRHLAG